MFVSDSTARKEIQTIYSCRDFVFRSLGLGMGFLFVVCFFFETEITYIQIKHMVVLHVKKNAFHLLRSATTERNLETKKKRKAIDFFLRKNNG